ncbi:MAG: leucine-rich repeat protein [Clostridia bacterium]|nr:leucine-rich repeat protein [Clostridia bacterium]
MKKCPFCKANIEDNARFCVFCMSSLQEKRKIEIKQKNNKKWIYVIAAFLGWIGILAICLLLALLLIISAHFLIKNNTNNNSSYISGQTFSSDEQHIVENFKDNTENTTTQNNDNDYHSTEGNNSNNNGNDINKNSSTSSTNSSSTTSINSENSLDEDSSTNKTSNTDNSSLHSSNVDSSTTPTPSEATYTYRDATSADCYPPGHDSYAVENVIVITGVSSISSDGVYVIPEKIDGKKVGAIMPDAFSNPNVSHTVKKVVLPATVRTIWENAFSNCYNLTDIYLHSKVIAIYESALPDVSKRTGTLTIHCARDCRNFEFYYYRNIINKYDAQYKEWNGGDIE